MHADDHFADALFHFGTAEEAKQERRTAEALSFQLGPIPSLRLSPSLSGARGFTVRVFRMVRGLSWWP